MRLKHPPSTRTARKARPPRNCDGARTTSLSSVPTLGPTSAAATQLRATETPMQPPSMTQFGLPVDESTASGSLGRYGTTPKAKDLCSVTTTARSGRRRRRRQVMHVEAMNSTSLRRAGHEYEARQGMLSGVVSGKGMDRCTKMSAQVTFVTVVDK